MTTVLITGIGGSIGIDVARSLRRDPSVRIVGCDSDAWGRRQAAALCDEVRALPRADRGADVFADALDRIAREAGADFAFVNPDPELEGLAAIRRAPACPTPLPPIGTVDVAMDKSKTVAAAGDTGLFPRTVAIESEDELPRCFEKLAPPLWMRATVGPGGRGSLTVDGEDEARAWMTYWRRRGRAYRWLLQEYLPGRNINWTGLYVRGELVVQTAMERLRYFLGDAAASGVSGQVSRCATVDPAAFSGPSDRVVRALDGRPHGLYSVDLREDRDGRALVTEVNPRLAGRPWLYTSGGVNLPLAAVRALSGADLGDAVTPEGLLVGLHLHRQLDIEPVVGYPEGEGSA